MSSVPDAQRLGVNITTIVDAILKDFEWSGEAVITQYNHKDSHRLPTGHRNALPLVTISGQQMVQNCRQWVCQEAK